MHASRFLGLLFALLLASATAFGQTVDVRALTDALKGGGYVIVFRHGATNRDQADTNPLDPDDVSRQRLLSTAGRDAARQIGAVFQSLQIPIDRTYTSKFNRASETGRLIAGGDVVTTLDLTEGGLVVTPIENDRRAQCLRDLAAMPPAKGKNTLVVTHKPNILDAFGKDWFEVKEGEASVFQPTGDGKSRLVARVQAAEWVKAIR